MAKRNVNGVTFAYSDSGQGNALVLVHGFPLDRQIWEDQVVNVSGDCRVIAADLRGLVLVDTRAEADTPEGKQGRQKMIDLVRSSGSSAVAEQMMPKMTAPGLEQRRPEVASRLRAIMNACPPKTIEHALAAMRDRPDLTGF